VIDPAVLAESFRLAREEWFDTCVKINDMVRSLEPLQTALERDDVVRDLRLARAHVVSGVGVCTKTTRRDLKPELIQWLKDTFCVSGNKAKNLVIVTEPKHVADEFITWLQDKCLI
jgi:hypothetical protein